MNFMSWIADNFLTSVFRKEIALKEDVLKKRLDEFVPLLLVEDVTTVYDECEAAKLCSDEINLAKVDYFDLNEDNKLQQVAEKSIRKYGVGTCGPPSFYGTSQVHNKLDSCLADFLGTELAVIYSDATAGILTTLACFLLKEHVVFYDENANFSIKEGLKASRCKAISFPHNNYEMFETLAALYRNEKKFVVLEGICAKTGKICPVHKFLKISKRLKIRVFIDESFSLGALGKTGKGVLEYCNIEPDDVDLIMGNFIGAFGLVGGFAAGKFMVASQLYLKCAGYLFSASLPVYLCKFTLKSLNLVEKKSQELRFVVNIVYEHLKKHYSVTSDPESPRIILHGQDDMHELQIYEQCKQKGIRIIYQGKGSGLIINLHSNLLRDKEKLQKVLYVFKKAAVNN